MEDVLNQVDCSKRGWYVTIYKVIESDTEPETGNEETANETEVETEPQQKSETAGDEEEDSEVIRTIDQTTQTIIEKRNAKTETDCNFVCSSPIPFMIR